MVKLDDQLPPKDGYYLVACKGGNVMESYYIADREQAMSRSYATIGKTYYSKRRQGQHSAHFEVAHTGGYEIEYWVEMPRHPDYPPKS